MFASQLLRILQSLPADVNHETCVFDTAEETPTMKGTQKGLLSQSNGYKEDDSLGFPTNGFVNSNVYGNSVDSLASDTKDGNELWKVSDLDDAIFFDDISRNNNNEIKTSSMGDDHDISKIYADKRAGNPFACDVPVSNTNEIVAATVMDDQNGGLSNISPRKSGNPFECDTKDRDQPWNIPEFECSMIVDFLDDKESADVDSNSPFTSHSKLFETNTSLYTDKVVTDHELPELTVCYRESNFNIVKDICMDEGVPAEDKVLIESWKDNQPSTSVPVSADEEKQSNTRENEPPSSVSNDLSVEDAKNVALTHDTEQEDTAALDANGVNPSPVDNSNKDGDKDSYLEDLMTIFGSKCTTNGKATNASENASLANNVVHLEDSNFKNSQKVNTGDDQSALQPDMMPTAVSAANETNDKGPASNISNNVDKCVENLPEHSPTSNVVSLHKDGNPDDVSATSQVHIAKSVERSVEPQNVTSLEDHKLSGNLPPGGQGHFADGEASFAAGHVSGSITYSGPITYSGSISLRSDSSTTSARSFAFPVLQSEWNSSPVRMAKAERRRLRKEKGWKQGLLCCRF